MSDNRLSARTLVALLLAPILLAGLVLLGTWNSGDRLRTVDAAVVNLDQMVTVNGQQTPLGRQFTAELVDSGREQNLNWVLADEEGAREGLASGRFAMIDDGLGFQLVPWSPSLEKQIGRHVSGVARDDGGVDWDFGRKRGLGL